MLTTAAAATLLATGTAHAVVGGVSAPDSYQAALVTAGDHAFDGQFCGGSVIAPDAILTAAHCVTDTKASRLTVVTGRTALSDEASGTRTGVARIIVHPGYHGDGHDVAVLRLTRAVTVTPVALALPTDAPTWAAGRPLVVSGWGRTSNAADDEGTDALRATAVTVRSARRCDRAYGYGFSSRLMICAGGARHDSCEGDSGGPLVTQTASGSLVQAGIVSYGGNRCASDVTPGVYTKVAAERAFIDQAAGLTPVTAPPSDAR